MLIDEFVPEYDFRSRHDTVVPAPAEAVRQAIAEWRPADSFLWRLLLRLRGLGRPDGTLREWAEAMGFLRLAETEDGVAYGQIGRFWAARERAALVSPRTVEEFRRFDDPTCAVAVMVIGSEPSGSGRTRLYTETRVRALGPQARRRFRLYWLAIGPFSGLLRRSMLNGVKARALAIDRQSPALQQRERSV
ncbi:MAG: hypothetical protein WD379_01125 [Dehalococcoidia bacterium]